MSGPGPSQEGPGGDRSDPERFILSGPAAVLGPLRPALERDPTVSVVASRSDRLIVETTPMRADELAATLAPAVVVVPDDPLPTPTPAAPPAPPAPPAP